MNRSMLDDLKRDGLVSQLVKRIADLEAFEREWKLKQFGAGGGGNWTLISETLLGAPSANFDFVAIPATYRSLCVVMNTRTTEAITWNFIRVRFNGDAGANYNSQHTYSIAAATTAVEELSQTSGNIGVNAGANSVAPNTTGTTKFVIANYVGTTFGKIAIKESFMIQKLSTGGQVALTGGVYWNSTAAINQITLFPTANNFDTGSVASLYGLT